MVICDPKVHINLVLCPGRSQKEVVQDRWGDPRAAVPQACPCRVPPQAHCQLQPLQRQHPGDGHPGRQCSPPRLALTGLQPGPRTQIGQPQEEEGAGRGSPKQTTTGALFHGLNKETFYFLPAWWASSFTILNLIFLKLWNQRKD